MSGVERADGARGADVFPRRWIERGLPDAGQDMTTWIKVNIAEDRARRVPRHGAGVLAEVLARRDTPC